MDPLVSFKFLSAVVLSILYILEVSASVSQRPHRSQAVNQQTVSRQQRMRARLSNNTENEMSNTIPNISDMSERVSAGHRVCTAENTRLRESLRVLTAVQSENTRYQVCSTDMLVFTGQSSGANHSRYSFNLDVTEHLVAVKAKFYAKVRFQTLRAPVALMAILKTYDGMDDVIIQSQADRQVCLDADVSCHVQRAYNKHENSWLAPSQVTMVIGMSIFCKYEEDGDYRSCKFDIDGDPYVMTYYFEQGDLQQNCKRLSLFPQLNCPTSKT